MRMAFLFLEKYPNYDLDMQLFDNLGLDEIGQLDTYIRTGIWGINFLDIRDVDELKNTIFRTLYQNDRRWIVNNLLPLDKMLSELVYIVLFESISVELAKKLHNQLTKKTDNYIGLTEVITSGYYPIIFSMLPYRYKIDKKKILALYSSLDNDEFIADEIIDWAKEKFNQISILMDKYDVGGRFAVFNEFDGTLKKDFEISSAIEIITNEWQIITEQTIYKLLDIIPDAVEELISISHNINKYSLSVAECASVAVNVRRIYEKLGNYLNSNSSDGYRTKIEKFINDKFKDTKPYQDYLQSELREVSTRMDKLIALTNKGIHEDWMVNAIKTIILRSIVTLKEIILPVKVVKPTVLFDESIFDISEE